NWQVYNNTGKAKGRYVRSRVYTLNQDSFYQKIPELSINIKAVPKEETARIHYDKDRYSIEFDGVDDSAIGNAGVAGIDEVTVEFWIYVLTNPPGQTGLVLHTGSPPFPYFMGLTYRSDGLIELGSQRQEIITSKNSYPLNTWIHVAGTYKKGTKEISLYVYEQYQGTFTKSVEYAFTGNCLISYNYGGQPGHFRMHDIRIWNVIRTEAQIKASMYKSIDNAT